MTGPLLKTQLLAESDTWITVHQASRLLNISERLIYDLLGEYLVFRRPSPRRIVISLASARALRRATADPEFWQNATSKNRLRNHVLHSMKTLIADALQT